VRNTVAAFALATATDAPRSIQNASRYPVEQNR
jgi:hypothetical protein